MLYITFLELNYNRKVVPFHHFHPFLPHTTQMFWQLPICSLFLWVNFFFFFKIPYISEILGLRRSPGVGNGNLLQYSCLENSFDRGAWLSLVHGVAKTGTLLSNRSHAHSVVCWDILVYQGWIWLQDTGSIPKNQPWEASSIFYMKYGLEKVGSTALKQCGWYFHFRIWHFGQFNISLQTVSSILWLIH